MRDRSKSPKLEAWTRTSRWTHWHWPIQQTRNQRPPAPGPRPAARWQTELARKNTHANTTTINNWPIWNLPSYDRVAALKVGEELARVKKACTNVNS
jgi:hypothetical protein